MTAPALRTEGLTRRFGTLAAVDGVDLAVFPGEVYGFLGRNGQGKTTLIRMLLGLIRPTAGSATVLGHRVGGGQAARRPGRARGAAGPGAPWAQVGYLVEGPGLYPQLTVADHLRLAARYRSLPSTAAPAAVTRLGLQPYADVPVRALSLGNRQRLGLALALVHRPAVLILDEPVNGLDPAGVVQVRELLRELARDGVTVFMSTHLVGEVARLADRVGIIHRGRLVEELPAEGLRAGGRLVAGLPDPAMLGAATRALRAAHLHPQPDGDGARLVCGDARAVAHPEEVATLLVRAGVPPRYLAVEAEDLEDHFLRLTQEEVPA